MENILPSFRPLSPPGESPKSELIADRPAGNESHAESGFTALTGLRRVEGHAEMKLLDRAYPFLERLLDDPSRA